jgi:hypothetical protein
MPSFGSVTDLWHVKEPLRLYGSWVQGEILSAISCLSFRPSLTEGSALERLGALQRAPRSCSMDAPGGKLKGAAHRGPV